MIRFLTFTGADDNTAQKSLFDLADKYPFVEWGILASLGQQGRPRYPSPEWIDSLATMFHETDKKYNFSLHLCGRLVRQFVNGKDVFPNFGADVFDMFKRVQINTHGEDHDWDLPGVITLLNTYPDHEFIFQLDGNGKNQAMAKMLVLEHGLKNVSFLFDLSSGAGILPEHGWLPPQTEKGSYGYAGGLGLDNIVEQINQVVKAAQQRDDNKCGIWLDMETKVRSNRKSQGPSGPRATDIFDLQKIEDIIQICLPWYEPSQNSAHSYTEGDGIK